MFSTIDAKVLVRSRCFSRQHLFNFFQEIQRLEEEEQEVEESSDVNVIVVSDFQRRVRLAGDFSRRRKH